ncbi:bacteriohemerythrin [Fundidesulfovibrio butyratiphilus]
MKRLQWSDSLSVGVYLIDKQHMDLVELINNIADALEAGAEKRAVSQLIRRFYDYTTTHFQAEESLMDHETYADYFEQVRQHLDCSMKALEFHRRFSMEEGFDLYEFYTYIAKWFLEHTSGIDKTLGDHIRQHGGTCA